MFVSSSLSVRRSAQRLFVSRQEKTPFADRRKGFGMGVLPKSYAEVRFACFATFAANATSAVLANVNTPAVGCMPAAVSQEIWRIRCVFKVFGSWRIANRNPRIHFLYPQHARERNVNRVLRGRKRQRSAAVRLMVEHNVRRRSSVVIGRYPPAQPPVGWALGSGVLPKSARMLHGSDRR